MNLNRRNFLFGSAAAAALAGCATTKKGVRTLKDGEKPTVAIIGYGLRARDLTREFLGLTDMCRVTAVCDCDKERLAAGVKRVNDYYAEKKIANRCEAYADFRDVIKNPDIDMVCIATPDHWHAYMSVEAMKAGKDVYCEKPLTFNVDESRKVMAAQKKYDRVFQTGSMQRCWPEFRTAVMIVRNGFIGDVMYVDANYGRGGQKLGGPSHPMRFFDEPDKAATEGASNANVDWNMWLGPAKWRPYSDRLAPRGMHKSYSQVMFWRFDDDIGTGYNGDWGAHHLDIAQWGLDADKSGPYKIIRSDEPYSDNLFHGCRRQFGMKMLFKKPYGDVELYHGPFGTWGTVFYGTHGIVAVNRGKIAVWKGIGVKPTEEIRKQLADATFNGMELVAASIGKDYGTDASSKKDNNLDAALKKLVSCFNLDSAKTQIYKSTDKSQVRNFVEHYYDRKPTQSPAETGGRSAILCQLCNMSYVYDTGFDWDPEKNDFAGENAMGISLTRDCYRNGWEVVV
jgi:predicted dehydrogenase